MIWRHPEHTQQLRLEKSIISHLEKYKQRTLFSLEAGGQLFGLVTPNEVSVKRATGPYPRDVRSRHNYRSNLISAQREIALQAKCGLLYLGEWHTHPEDYPSPSDEDLVALSALFAKSRLNTSSIILVIRGQSASPLGTSVFSYDGRVCLEWGCDVSYSSRQSLLAKFIRKSRHFVVKK